MSASHTIPPSKRSASKVNEYQLSLFDLKLLPALSEPQIRPGRVEDFPDAEKQCLDQETEILTRTGWVKMNEMTYDHEVANWHKHNGTITFTKPKLILIRDRKPDEQMVVLETQRRSIRVVDTKNMAIRKYKNKNFDCHTALEVSDLSGEMFIPICGKAMPENYPLPAVRKFSKQEIQAKVRTISYNLRKKGYEPAKAREEALKIIQERYEYEYKSASELSLDECRLIGFWLGDGCASGARYTMAQSPTYPNIIAWVDQVLANCDYHFTRHDRSDRKNPHILWQLATGTGFGRMKRDGLLPILPYLTKKGTDLWKNFTVAQFEAFLEGLWYADGWHGLAESVPESKRIGNTNKSLLELIQWLAICRGFNASISEHHRPRKSNHNQLYKINIRRAETHGLNEYQPQAEETPFQEEKVWCVVNQTGHLVTRRNWKVAIL